jgi:hypothetical protein
MKAPTICIVHRSPVRHDGVCPHCEGSFDYEVLRDYRRIEQAERIANKLLAKYESELEQRLREQ